MSRIVSVYSFRRGTGKTTLVANLSSLLAVAGERVGVIDTAFRSPSIHILFGFEEDETRLVLNDYIWGRCDVEQAAYDLTPGLGDMVRGRLFLIPASTHPREIARVSGEGYDPDLLNEGFHALAETLELDVLMVDTHAGINEETLLSMAICDVLAVVLRIDKQDHQGTAITIDVARRLAVPQIRIVLNEIPQTFDFADTREEIEHAFGCEVAAVLPHSEDLMALSSAGIFALRHPEHPVTVLFKELAYKLIS